MSVVLKAKLKAAKTAIGDKDYEYAYSLSHDVLEMDAGNYAAHIYLGVACQHLGKWDEGEKTYRKAQGLPKANVLAWQGMCALYEAADNREKHMEALEQLRDWYMAAGDLEHAWETMHGVLAQLSEISGGERQLVAELSRLVGTGDLSRLLSAGACAKEVPSEREVLERMYTVESAYDERTVARETERRRTRLHGGGLDKVRSEVRSEVWGASHVLTTLSRLVQASMDVGDDAAQLTWEEQYLAALRERAPYVGCSGELEDEAMRVAEDLAQHGRCPAAFEMLLDARAAALGHTRDVRALASDYLRAFADLAADDGLVLGAAARALGMMHADGGADAQGVLAEADEGRRRAPGSAFAQTVWAVAAGGAQAYGALAEGAAAARAAVGTGQPGSWLVEFHVGRACLRLGMAESAALAYMRCVALRPDDPAALLGVGLARLALGDAAAAQAHLERALEATPSDEQAAQALAGLGACHLLADADDGASAAAEYLRRALLLDARMAHAHRDLGRALWRQGGAWRRDKQHAYASFLAAARLDPLDAAAFGGLGLWYAEVGHDAARAVKCLEKCVALDVGLQDGRPVERLAALYAQQGCDDRLQRLLERVTAADGQGAAVADRWAWAWRMLGLLYLRMPSDDATQQAERVLRRALALDRRDFVAWVALGDAYLAAGRPGAAARVAAHAASLRPTDPAARYLGARAHLHAGDAERALAEVLLARRLAASSAAAWRRVLPPLHARVLCACAERRLAAGLHMRAADACIDALEVLHVAAEEEGEQGVVLWDAVGVACALLARCTSEELEYAECVSALTRRAEDAWARVAQPAYLRDTPRAAHDGHGEWPALSVLAEHAAMLRIALARTLPQAAAAWFALGSVYLTLHATLHQLPLLSRSRTRCWHPLLVAARKCAHAAERLHGTPPSAHSTLLGCAAQRAGDGMLAQHAFIVAARTHPPAWSALAVLYAGFGDPQLARRAADRALLADPEHPHARLACALAAQLCGAPSVDLYEACVRSAPPTVADYAFARLVWRHAHRVSPERLALAAYAACRYAERFPEDPLGLLLRAQLVELLGPAHAPQAAHAYAQCLAHPRTPHAAKPAALAGHARALCCAGQPEDAAAGFADALALGWTPGALGHVSFGCALLLCGELEPALQQYEHALEQLGDSPGLRAAVGVRLAQVLWALGTPEHRALARDHLADVAQDDPHALAVLVAVAALLRDQHMLDRAAGSLAAFRARMPALVATSECLVACLYGLPALRPVARATAYAPHLPALRLLAARIARWQADGARARTHAAETLCLLANVARTSAAMDVQPEGLLGVAVEACEIVAVQDRCPRMARRAVMLRPWDTIAWQLV